MQAPNTLLWELGWETVLWITEMKKMLSLSPMATFTPNYTNDPLPPPPQPYTSYSPSVPYSNILFKFPATKFCLSLNARFSSITSPYPSTTFLTHSPSPAMFSYCTPYHFRLTIWESTTNYLIPLGDVGYMDHTMPFGLVKNQILINITHDDISLNSF